MLLNMKKKIFLDGVNVSYGSRQLPHVSASRAGKHVVDRGHEKPYLTDPNIGS
jgi:hypothetical protein